MRRRTQRTAVSSIIRVGLSCSAIVVCSFSIVPAHQSTKTIVCREELSAARRNLLAAKLNAITGLDLGFDANGALGLMDSEARGGSQTARDLLRKALEGNRVLVLEDASDRQDVVFSRVIPARLSHQSSEAVDTFVVLIDFADFERLIGDEVALRAFDVGWAFLHELDHVVNDYSDTTSANETGECESHINLMRRELDLPIRSGYFYALFPDSERSEFRTRYVRLAFDQKDASTKKRRRYWVMWDATVVGGLTAQVAAVR